MTFTQHTNIHLKSPECKPTLEITETANMRGAEPVFPNGILREVSPFTFFVQFKDKNKRYRHTYRQDITEYATTYTFDHEYGFYQNKKKFAEPDMYYNAYVMRCYCNLLPNDPTNYKDDRNIIWFVYKGKQVFFKRPVFRKVVEKSLVHNLLTGFEDEKTGVFTPIASQSVVNMCIKARQFYVKNSHLWRRGK